MLRYAALLPLLAFCAPVKAAVYEVGEDGAVERLDTPPPVVAVISCHRTPATSSNARAAQFQSAVKSAAMRYEVSPALIDAIAHVESRYNPVAVSRVGASGIMQLMPGTARDLGVTDNRDPAANIRGGTAYLRMLLNRFDGDVVRTVAAYNAGPAAVIRAGGIPRYPETIRYVASVMERLATQAQ